MIGHFVFMAGAPANHIVLHMGWNGDTPMARVSSPQDVVDRFKNEAMNVREDDEYMSLPIALSYAVLLSSLSDAGLIVSGDRSAWPVEWGQLLDMQPYSVLKARSH